MQRTVISGVVVVLMLGVAAMGFAQSSDPAAALQAAGYTILNERAEGGLPTWDVRDGQGRRFSVSVLGQFTDQRMAALDAMREVIYGLDGLEVQRLRYVFERDRADAVVIPSAYMINGRDYVPYMPSGMQFQFEGAVAFDFRLLVDNLAVRINGQYLSQSQFTERIQRAVANPAAYIQSQDPQFLARRLDEQLRRIEQTEVTNEEQAARDAALNDQIQALARRGEAVLDREVRRGEEALTALDQRLSEEIAGLRAEQLDLIDGLNEDLATLREEFEVLRRGSVILASRNLFGSLKVVDPEVIVRVVELRASEPDLTPDEVLSRINAELPEGAEPLHKKHMQAIDALYFNRYE